MTWKWLFAGCSLSMAAVAGALIYAPYLPRLLREGYPQATWPAPGSFATVKGSSGGPEFSAVDIVPPNAELRALFKGADGRALLAAKNGRLVMEHYAEGTTRETQLNSYSLVKSLVAALVLKGIAEGKIESPETKASAILTELQGTGTGDIALCRLLDMRSGLVFQSRGKKAAIGSDIKDIEATKLNVFGPMARLHMTGIEGVEMQLVTRGPRPGNAADCTGGTYSYQNVNTALLGEILERAYRQPLQDILSEKIWRPAGAADAQWRRYDVDLPVTPYCCLYARPIDWLRIARFLMANGTPDSPFLPENLWHEFLDTDLSAAERRHGAYAYHAYQNVLDRPGERLQGPFTYFFGSKGQTVYLVPSDDLVAVRFGEKIQLLHSTLYGVDRSLKPTR